MALRAVPGTYALLLASSRQSTVDVGRWGRLELQPGCYIYAGSAFGPGGVRARVLRHCRQAKALHWHLDYLREQLEPLGAWLNYDPVHREHQWADTLLDMPGTTPIERFGCSDCACRTHLFHRRKRPGQARVAAMLPGHVTFAAHQSLSE